MFQKYLFLIAFVLLNCSDKKDLGHIGISCEFKVSQIIDQHVGFEEHGFSYHIYNIDSKCDSFMEEGYPILEKTKNKAKWIIQKWSNENSLSEKLIKHNLYFNELLSYPEKTKIKKQLERQDMLWSVYFNGRKFPVFDNDSLTLDNFKIYSFDLKSKKIHRFSSW